MELNRRDSLLSPPKSCPTNGVHLTALANQVKRLKGDPFLRLRVGDYRVIFTEEGIVLTVLRVGHRRKIYKH